MSGTEDVTLADRLFAAACRGTIVCSTSVAVPIVRSSMTPDDRVPDRDGARVEVDPSNAGGDRPVSVGADARRSNGPFEH